MSDCGKAISKELKAAAESKTTREPKNAQERKCQKSVKGMEGSLMPKTITTGLIRHLFQGSRMA